MRAFAAVLLAGLVAACAAPGGHLPADIQPISGILTFGVRPIEDAEHIQALTLTQVSGHSSTSGTIRTRSIVDITRSAHEFVIVLEVADAEVLGDDESLQGMRRQMGDLPGTVFTYRKDLRSGKESHKIRTASFDVEAVQAQADLITTMIADGYMGGSTIMQNQEVAHSAPNPRPDATQVAAISRVLGRTTHAGRPAVVFKVTGKASNDDNQLGVSGTVIVDEETGACLLSTLSTEGIPMGDGTGTITVVQRMTIF